MKLFTNSNAPDASLGIAERTAYMLGNVGIALINTIIASFIMYFYTDVMPESSARFCWSQGFLTVLPISSWE